MESPALLHKARVLAEMAEQRAHHVAPANPAVRPVGNSRLSLMLAALEAAQHELKSLNSLVECKKAKRERYIPQFTAFLNDYIQAGDVYANLVLVWVTLWTLDVRDIERALYLADICIKQQQPMPELRTRDMQTVAADEVLDWVNECVDASTSSAPYFEQVLERVLGGQWCVYEKIQVNYAKHAGDLAYAQNELMRVDVSLNAALVENLLHLTMARLNQSLAADRSAWQLAGFTKLADIPNPVAVNAYLRTLFCRTKAALIKEVGIRAHKRDADSRPDEENSEGFYIQQAEEALRLLRGDASPCRSALL